MRDVSSRRVTRRPQKCRGQSLTQGSRQSGPAPKWPSPLHPPSCTGSSFALTDGVDLGARPAAGHRLAGSFRRDSETAWLQAGDSAPQPTRLPELRGAPHEDALRSGLHSPRPSASCLQPQQSGDGSGQRGGHKPLADPMDHIRLHGGLCLFLGTKRPPSDKRHPRAHALPSRVGRRVPIRPRVASLPLSQTCARSDAPCQQQGGAGRTATWGHSASHFVTPSRAWGPRQVPCEIPGVLQDGTDGRPPSQNSRP